MICPLVSRFAFTVWSDFSYQFSTSGRQRSGSLQPLVARYCVLGTCDDALAPKYVLPNVVCSPTVIFVYLKGLDCGRRTTSNSCDPQSRLILQEHARRRAR